MPDRSCADVPSNQRFQQLAAILAKGVLHYQQRLRRGAEFSSESRAHGLEVPGETRLSVSRRTQG
jgi:hypothetical protein